MRLIIKWCVQSGMDVIVVFFTEPRALPEEKCHLGEAVNQNVLIYNKVLFWIFFFFVHILYTPKH